MKLPLITALCAELPPGGKPRNAAFKWFVSENKLRPLIFGNFLLKIFRKSKMGCAPHHRPNGQSLPPRGSQVNKALNIAFPSGGSLEIRL